MTKLYYIPQHKINARISETLVTGNHIKIGPYTYELISRAPMGRSVKKRYRNLSKDEQIVIYG